MIKLLNKIKVLALLVMFTGYLAISLINTLAADQSIICTSSGCSGLSDSLFNETSMAPGQSVTKSLDIYNNYGETMKLAMSVSENTAGTDDSFTPFVDVTVVTDGTAARYSGTLDNFLISYIDLEKLETNHHSLVEITLALQNVGNEFQGKAAKFSFDIKIDQEVPGTGGGAAAASPSPSPSASAGVVAGLTSAPLTVPEEVLGEATPAAGPAEGMVEGEQTYWRFWPWLLLLPPGFFFFLKWWRKRRKMD